MELRVASTALHFVGHIDLPTYLVVVAHLSQTPVHLLPLADAQRAETKLLEKPTIMPLLSHLRTGLCRATCKEKEAEGHRSHPNSNNNNSRGATKLVSRNLQVAD